MALNKREQTMATVGGVAVGLFVLYWLISTLYLDPRNALNESIKKANTNYQAGKTKIATAVKDENIWPNLGIQDLKQDPDAGENMGALVSDAYTAAARNAGIIFTSFYNQDLHTSSGRTDYMELRFNAQTNTTTARLARFLYAVETNNVIPARIESFKVNARKPGTDDLHVDMVISALIYNPKSPIPSTNPKSPKGTTPALAATKSGLDPDATKKIEAAMEAKRKASEEEAAKAAAMPKPTQEQIEAEMEAKRKASEANTATAATKPTLTPAEMEAEMMKRRAAEEKGATTPTSAPGGAK